MADRSALFALLLGSLVVLLLPRPPKTPAAVKGREALTRWGCSAETEDPLYRTVEPRAWRGVEPWTLQPESQAVVEVVYDGDRIEPLAFPLSGQLRFDTRNLDAVEGTLAVEVAPLGKKAPQVGEQLRAWAPAMAVEVVEASVGTAPRFDGGEARGEVTFALRIGDWRGEYTGPVAVRRLDDDSFALFSPLPTTGALDAPGTGTLVQQVGELWGVGVVSEDLQVRFALVVERVSASADPG